MANTRDQLSIDIKAAVASGNIEHLRVLTEPEEITVSWLIELLVILPRVNLEDEGKACISPFMQAAAHGHVEVTKYLLWLAKRYQDVLDLDLLDGSGMTALMYAAKFGRQAIVELLLAAQCDPRIKFAPSGKQDPISIAELARREGHHNVAQLLETAVAAKSQTAAANRAQRIFMFYQQETAGAAIEPVTKKSRTKGGK